MLTASQRNLLGILALADGAAVSIENTYKKRKRNKTVLSLCNRVHRTVYSAMDAFGLVVKNERTLSSIEKRVADFDQKTFAGTGYTAPVLLSTVLGILDGPLRRVRDPKRKKALERVDRALVSLNRHFDRRLDRFDDYEVAGRFADSWSL